MKADFYRSVNSWLYLGLNSRLNNSLSRLVLISWLSLQLSVAAVLKSLFVKRSHS
ncbi:MAG: hypothetical protein N2235_23000 [Fischerella sp.]|nr:hypothetical protein [Fischerella sp.]